MKKRPLCLMALVLTAGILLARWMGISWIWRSPGGSETMIWAGKESPAAAEGIVYQQEEKIFSNQTYTYLYLKHTSLFINSKKYPIRNLKCIIKKKTESYTGCRLYLTGTLTMPELPGNPGEFDQRAYEQARKTDFHLEDARVEKVIGERRRTAAFFAGIRSECAGILEQLFPETEAGILEAMLLGEKKQLDGEIKSRYQAAGISHIMAISGLHISLLGMAVWKGLKALGAPLPISSGVSFALLAGYGFLIGNPTTAFRALLMFGIMMGAKILGRAYDMMSALAAAGILLLLDNPDLLYDCGFRLSFLAVAGIGFCGKVKREMQKQRGDQGRRWKQLKENLEMGIGLWFFSLPVVLHAFYQVSVIGILCNLLVLPLMPGVLGSGVLALVLGRWNIRIGSVAGILAYGILHLYEWLGKMAEKIPFGIWTPGQPSAGAIVAYYMIMAVSWKICGKFLKEGRRKKAGVLSWITAAVLILLMAAPWKNPTQITVLDVGQGDGIVVRSGDDRILIDGGSSSKKNPGTYVILPYLKQQGISYLNGIFLTHTDLDHINGVQEVLEEAKKGWLSVEYLFMPFWMGETEEGKEMIQTAKVSGIKCRYLKSGDQVRMGKIKIDILHPGTEDFSQKPNEGSLVFSLEADGMSGLFTGDLPTEEEEKMLERILPCDFLKAGHHGSDGSSGTEFLNKAVPKITLISCGKNNRYGHPGRDTQKRLEQAGSRIFRTDRQGALTIRVKRKEWELYGYRREEIFLAQ